MHTVCIIVTRMEIKTHYSNITERTLAFFNFQLHSFLTFSDIILAIKDNMMIPIHAIIIQDSGHYYILFVWLLLLFMVELCFLEVFLHGFMFANTLVCCHFLYN
jgi:hypothetical protein